MPTRGPRIYLSLFLVGLLLPTNTTASLGNNGHSLSDLYTNSLRKEFNDCMANIEKENLSYHSCLGFSSPDICRCSFLKEVDHQCKSLGQRSNNYWYFEYQMGYVCKGIGKTDKILVSPPGVRGNNAIKYHNHLSISASDTYSIDTLQKYYSVSPEYHQPKTFEDDNKVFLIVDRLQERSKVAFDTLDFTEYYEKKKPNAMTINCPFMRSLKTTASPTNNQMTRFSTTLLIQNPTGPRTTSIEVIKVLPKDQERPRKERRHEENSSNDSLNSSVNTTNVAVVYLSGASFFSQELPLMLLILSVLVSIILLPLAINF